MWAKFKKTSETPSKVSYDYGFESHKLTGKIEFNKETKEIKFIKYAEKDDAANANIFTKRWIYKLFFENFPQERMIAIG